MLYRYVPRLCVFPCCCVLAGASILNVLCLRCRWIQAIHVVEMLAYSQYESVALLLYRRSRICVGSLVPYVCVCGRITSLRFSVDWTSSSLSREDLSGLSWHRSCPGHLWEAAVVWAPGYSSVYLCLCLAITHRVLPYRVIFFTRWKHSRVPGYPLARVTTLTDVDDTASLSLCQGIPQYP